MTEAAQQQGTRLTTMRHRRKFFFTTNGTIIFFEKSLAFLTNISYSLQMTNCIVALKIEKELQNGKR
ncbi:MAG: hypothetical protein IKC77_05380 [Lentisphaeria bacterium]|nr:hypothetical protein [Lentisphaeria bacterium]